MKRINLGEISTDELVERFVTVAIDQDWAIFHDDHAKYNRLYRQMDEIENELKSRPGDQRRALVQLYDHPNIQVRLKAALRSMELMPMLPGLSLRKSQSPAPILRQRMPVLRSTGSMGIPSCLERSPGWR